MTKPLVAVVGRFQTGKSQLINCLLGGAYAALGQGLPTTATPKLYHHLDHPPPKGIRVREQQPLSSKILETMHLVDTPGFGVRREPPNLVRSVMRSADFLLVVATQGPSTSDTHLEWVVRSGRHRRVGLILNCGIVCPENPLAPACQEVLGATHRHFLRIGIPELCLSHPLNVRRVYQDLNQQQGSPWGLGSWREFFQDLQLCVDSFPDFGPLAAP